MEIIAQRNPSVKVDMNVSRYLDRGILDELEREGFFKKLAGKWAPPAGRLYSFLTTSALALGMIGALDFFYRPNNFFTNPSSSNLFR